MDIRELAMRAKNASRSLVSIGTKKKNEALGAICISLVENADYILKENEKDLIKAKEKGVSDAMADRLRLNQERIEAMADGVKKIIALDDPIGETIGAKTLPNGLKVSKVTVPMGLIGVIYESRPNVTLDTAALCLKASSAVILRGGSDAYNSNKAIATVMKDAIEKVGINPDCISFVEDTSRDTATALMKLNGIVDLLIPRGGANLIRTVVENATV
ncbi:MAG: gamma-glutamyl-phosphate reductase, partial [Clostridia bacterium]|nr:gamma-glutamyl-phosphate reductase [Clostridia bacterium]